MCETATDKERLRFRPCACESCKVTFSPNSKLLAHAGSEAVTVWDAATGNERFSLPAPKRMVFRAVAFPPDGRTLATAASPAANPPEAHTNGLKLWDVLSRKELRRFGGEGTSAFAVVFSADGRTLLSLSEDGVRLWEVLTGRERGRIEARLAGNPKRMALRRAVRPGAPLLGQMLTFDLRDMTFRKAALKRRPECAVCRWEG